MNDLLVFSTGTEQGSRLFKRSCELQNITPVIFDFGYPGHAIAKIRYASKFLQDYQEPFVLFADAHDSIVLDNAKSILDKYQRIGAEIVISAEKTCWPDSEISTHFPYPRPPFHNSPWRFINAGGWMGERRAILGALDLMDTAGFVDRWQGDDQRCWQEFFLRGTGRQRMHVDSGCEIFQTMSGVGGMELGPNGDNLITHCQPKILHFNGRTPNIGLWYRTLTGDLGWKEN